MGRLMTLAEYGGKAAGMRSMVNLAAYGGKPGRYIDELMLGDFERPPSGATKCR